MSKVQMTIFALLMLAALGFLFAAHWLESRCTEKTVWGAESGVIYDPQLRPRKILVCE